MTWFNLGDGLLLAAFLFCVFGGIWSGVVQAWVGMACSLVTALGFVAVWLMQWLPRAKALSHKAFTTEGITVYVYPGAGTVTQLDFAAELVLASLAVMKLTGLNNQTVYGFWKKTCVFFVPFIDPSAYPDLSQYKTLAGLAYDTQRVVALKPGQALTTSAMSHEMCHVAVVNSTYGDEVDTKIEEALKAVRG